ncbi:unnamed protein product, partial [Tilletia caries]
TNFISSSRLLSPNSTGYLSSRKCRFIFTDRRLVVGTFLKRPSKMELGYSACLSTTPTRVKNKFPSNTPRIEGVGSVKNSVLQGYTARIKAK